MPGNAAKAVAKKVAEVVLAQGVINVVEAHGNPALLAQKRQRVKTKNVSQETAASLHGVDTTADTDRPVELGLEGGEREAEEQESGQQDKSETEKDEPWEANVEAMQQLHCFVHGHKHLQLTNMGNL